MDLKSKVFLDIILGHSKNPRRVKRILTIDKRLSQSEKMIVHGFLLMRDNKNHEALEMAEDISKQSDHFVEGMRQYLVAAVLNNLGHFKRSLMHFTLCHEVFPKNQNTHLEFVILYNLYVVNCNLHQLTKAKMAVDQMKTMKNLNNEDTLSLMIASFWLNCTMENRKPASVEYQTLLALSGQFKNHDYVTLQKSFFHYGLIFAEYDLCNHALAKLSTQKKHAQLQTFNYMKLLLEHITEDKPIYIQEAAFKNHQKLLWELKAIRALDNHRPEEFSEAWNFLRQSHPETFLADRTYQGPKSLFSECLKLHQDKIRKEHNLIEIRPKNLTALQAIELKLQQESGITREELFYFIYGKEAESKDELLRISKYINSLKTEKNLKVVFKRGLYSLAA